MQVALTMLKPVNLAYTCTSTMIIPFHGSTIGPHEDSFNFHQSQVRITIERCFGVFVARWGILWKPMRFSLKNIMKILHALCRLHNFCINQSIPVLQVQGTQQQLMQRDPVTGVLMNTAEWRVPLPIAREHENVFAGDRGPLSGNSLIGFILERLQLEDILRPTRF